MNREKIVSEMRRIASENDGSAPGQELFEKTTGVSPGQWRGKFWLRWSDAVSEAGLIPGQMQKAHSAELLLKSLAALTHKYGHFPTSAELRMARTEDESFPSHGSFERLGNKSERVAQLRRFASQHELYADILGFLPVVEPKNADDRSSATEGFLLDDGFVYMLKLGKHYKIGKTFAVPRRHRQINLELPEKTDVVHTIRTDDPDGIEAYWHKRFGSKQTNGEWFALDSQDIKVFKRRKFM